MKLKFIYVLTLLLFSSCATTSNPKPSQDEAMKAIEEAATPGANHKFLMALKGDWEATVSFWQAPDVNPDVSKARAKGESILGGRFVEESFDGMFFGAPFYGRGITGFNNVTNKFTSVWADSMGTGFMKSDGELKDNAIYWSGSYVCPITKAEKSSTAKTTFIDEKTHIFEMWEPDPKGDLFRSLMIEYKRKSGSSPERVG